MSQKQSENCIYKNWYNDKGLVFFFRCILLRILNVCIETSLILVDSHVTYFNKKTRKMCQSMYLPLFIYYNSF